VGNEACFRKANDDRSKVFFEGKAVRLAQLTANRLQPMQMKRRARLKEAGGLSFRKERPWSWQQVFELSLPGLMSDNQQGGHCG
jgi:hypothetical protein